MFQFLRSYLADEGVLPSMIDDEIAKWELIPAYRSGEMCGVLMKRGTEIHICAKPEFIGRAITRKNLIDIISKLFEKHEYLTTKVLHHQEGEMRFLKRCGFTETWRDEIFAYFMITEVCYAKKLPTLPSEQLLG